MRLKQLVMLTALTVLEIEGLLAWATFQNASTFFPLGGFFAAKVLEADIMKAIAVMT